MSIGFAKNVSTELNVQLPTVEKQFCATPNLEGNSVESERNKHIFQRRKPTAPLLFFCIVHDSLVQLHGFTYKSYKLTTTPCLLDFGSFLIASTS